MKSTPHSLLRIVGQCLRIAFLLSCRITPYAWMWQLGSERIVCYSAVISIGDNGLAISRNRRPFIGYRSVVFK